MPTQPKEVLPPWGNALAGATGAVIANAAVYPLDIVKTRLQVQSKPKDAVSQEEAEGSIHYKSTADAVRKIVDDEGYIGLYSGLPSALIGVASTNFAYFYWYSVQTQARGGKKGLLDTGREVVNGEDGWTGLWRGLKASLVLVVNPAITYGAYERLREVLFPGKRSLRPWEAFILGATCKAVATIVTQPLIVAKVGLQSQPPPARRGKPFRSVVEVMRYIVRNEGSAGWFKGIGPQLMKGLLVQGLLMMTKER
ncbi:MAG: ADP/ATP carrier protein [Lichina confinis]|nr:MAG: ADP/ATP carrier protein [Lichina confinis]